MSAKQWEDVYPVWCRHAKNDPYREHILFPETIRALGDVSGRRILDLGCGNGEYSIMLAEKGGVVDGVDVSQSAIKNAQIKNLNNFNNMPRFHHCNAENLYIFEQGIFDIILCAMSLMDFENYEKVVQEISRVSAKSCVFLASIRHPCFLSRNSHWVMCEDKKNEYYSIENYFGSEYWTEEIGGKEFPFRHMQLSNYINPILFSGYSLNWIKEPIPNSESINAEPSLHRLLKIPKFLFMHFTKL